MGWFSFSPDHPSWRRAIRALQFFSHEFFKKTGLFCGKYPFLVSFSGKNQQQHPPSVIPPSWEKVRVKIKPPGDLRFWSMFPLTRVPFGVPIFGPQLCRCPASCAAKPSGRRGGSAAGRSCGGAFARHGVGGKSGWVWGGGGVGWDFQLYISPWTSWVLPTGNRAPLRPVHNKLPRLNFTCPSWSTHRRFPSLDERAWFSCEDGGSLLFGGQTFGKASNKPPGTPPSMWGVSFFGGPQHGGCPLVSLNPPAKQRQRKERHHPSPFEGLDQRIPEMPSHAFSMLGTALKGAFSPDMNLRDGCFAR